MSPQKAKYLGYGLLFSVFVLILTVANIATPKIYKSKADSLFPAQPFAENYDLNAFQAGGSDYVVYDLGDYATNPTKENLEKLDSVQGSIKFVVPSYDLNPVLVNTQLQEMCNRGQRKIGLTLWYAPFSSSVNPEQTKRGMVNSSGGVPTNRTKNNISNILKSIGGKLTADNKRCFNEIQFRLAPMGSAAPAGWTAWNQTRYDENKKFVFAIRDLVTSALSGSSVKVFFDLSAEDGGRTDGQIAQYTERLWSDYTQTYGYDDTFGFSVAWASGRFKNLFAMFKKVGKIPPVFAVDIYDQGSSDMTNIYSAINQEMTAAGVAGKPLLIQETWFTNKNSYTQSVNAKYVYNLKIHSLMQWQLEKSKFLLPDGSQRAFSIVSPEYIYMSIPFINNYGLGCTDNKCIWFKGNNFSSKCSFNIYNSNSVLISQLTSANTQVYCTDTYATVRIPDNIYNSNQIIKVILLSSFGSWSNNLTIKIR